MSFRNLLEINSHSLQQYKHSVNQGNDLSRMLDSVSRMAVAANQIKATQLDHKVNIRKMDLLNKQMEIAERKNEMEYEVASRGIDNALRMKEIDLEIQQERGLSQVIASMEGRDQVTAHLAHQGQEYNERHKVIDNENKFLTVLGADNLKSKPLLADFQENPHGYLAAFSSGLSQHADSPAYKTFSSSLMTSLMAENIDIINADGTKGSMSYRALFMSAMGKNPNEFSFNIDKMTDKDLASALRKSISGQDKRALYEYLNPPQASSPTAAVLSNNGLTLGEDVEKPAVGEKVPDYDLLAGDPESPYANMPYLQAEPSLLSLVAHIEGAVPPEKRGGNSKEMLDAVIQWIDTTLPKTEYNRSVDQKGMVSLADNVLKHYRVNTRTRNGAILRGKLHKEIKNHVKNQNAAALKSLTQ